MCSPLCGPRSHLSHRFHTKVSDLHTELYKGPAAATANPLVAFTLVKRLHSEWLNVVYSNEAQEAAQSELCPSPSSPNDT